MEYYYTIRKIKRKSSVVERRNKTIKQRLFKLFTANNNTVFWDKIPDIFKDYNNPYHSSIQMTPTEASKIKNSKLVFANLYSGEIYKQIKIPKFSIDDKVRISK